MIPLPDHEARRAALTDFQKNLVVTAGAGTGKTSLLVGRLVAALVLHHLEPHQVLAVTFTENAATEMRERLIRMLESVRPFVLGGAEASGIEPSDAYILEQLDLGPESLPRVAQLLEQVEILSISTFHGFCLSLLRENARRLDLPPNIHVGDADGGRSAFEEVFLECLREASETDVHEALHRFDATELRELALECIELPEDSLDRIANVAPPQDLSVRRDELGALMTEFPNARDNWRAAAADLQHCYDALLDDQRPQSQWIEKKTPQGGKQRLGEHAERATRSLDEHRRFLAPWVLSDREGIAIAIDFVRPVLRRYRQRIATNGELGFQDLLLLARRSLRQHADLRAEMGRRLHCILVDEFQDTDPLQYDVIFMLAAEQGGSVADPMEATLRPGCLFIVGDAKQSIYRFRRADVAAFSRAVQCIGAQGGRLLDLTANFRSRRPILDFVNAVCEQSLGKDRPYQFGYTPVVPMLEGETHEDAADRVEVLEVGADHELRSDERRYREGNIVVRKITEMHAAGRPFGDVAILLRATTETSWILRPLRAAGIPYVLEGSRRFYQRQEVVLCRALLGAMARPHDPVAVLALLRSALSNASDAEIAEHIQSGRSLDFRVDEGDVGPVAACLGYLRRLHDHISTRPVDEALTHLLTLPEMRLAEGAGFEGAQRLANIERLLHKLLRREPHDLADAASSLAQNTDIETEDEESPLFDGGVDAVRVLTVHRAKGLEFPVVFIPDLARQSAYRERTGLAQAQRLFDKNGIEMVTVRIGDTRNVASLLNKDAGRRHDEAEQRRLFYVAATRAKEKLFLVRAESASRRRRLWQDDLDHGSAHYDRSCVAGSLPPGRRDRQVMDPHPALLARAAHEELRERQMRGVRAPDVAPSRQTAPTEVASRRQLTLDFVTPSAKPTATVAKRTEPNRPGPAPSEAAEIGTAMHSYLALVDLSRETVDEELIRQLPHAGEIRDMAEQYHGSELRARLAAAAALRREVPLTFVDDGAIVHGVVDLIVEESDGSTTVLDWKTDRLEMTEPEERAEIYRSQLTSYGRGIQLAMGLKKAPETVVHFLRGNVTIGL